MAIITGSARKRFIGFKAKCLSDAAQPTDSVEIANMADELTHCFLGVQMFDANGDLVVGSAGTFAIKVKTDDTKQWEDPPETSIDATAPDTIGWDGNTTDVQVIPTGLAGVTTWRVHTTFNQR